ncbi:MAG: ribosome assembly RNA-binding protein YhbY [Gammaproteobacteria bacterium]|nr:ribosome assembly RNA-binding protein YhbY [Gammaproteobacteria bacterium]
MNLSEHQRRFLRGLAHRLEPCVLVGSAGVTAAVVAEVDRALDHHELIKVRIRAPDRDSRDAAIESLVAEAQAMLVHRIGHVAVLYRPGTTGQRLQLPAA